MEGFLWAHFAIFELIDGLTHGEPLSSATLQERLGKVPLDLKDIYSRIIRRKSQEFREAAGLFLLLITSAKTAVSTDLLWEAIKLAPKGLEAFQYPMLDVSNIRQGNSSQKYILSVTGGLVDADCDEHRQNVLDFTGVIVRITHRTVQTYLDENGWQEIFGERIGNALGDILWLHICAESLRSEGLDDIQVRNPHLHDHRTLSLYHSESRPLLEDLSAEALSTPPATTLSLEEQPSFVLKKLLPRYTLHNMPFHASSFEMKSARSSFPIIHTILLWNYMWKHRVAAPELDKICCCDSERGNLKTEKEQMYRDPIHLAIGHSLHLYVEDFLNIQFPEALSNSQSLATKSLSTAISGVWADLKRTFTSVQVCDIYNARKLAVSLARTQPGPGRARTLAVILKYWPVVEDAELAKAILCSDADVVEQLLGCRAPGKLRIKIPGDFGFGGG
jgi:hypothetical protein